MQFCPPFNSVLCDSQAASQGDVADTAQALNGVSACTTWFHAHAPPLLAAAAGSARGAVAESLQMMVWPPRQQAG